MPGSAEADDPDEHPAVELARVDGATGVIGDGTGLEGLLGLPAGSLADRDLFSVLADESVPRIVGALGGLLDEPGGASPVALRIRGGDGRFVVLSGVLRNEGSVVSRPDLVLEMHRTSRETDTVAEPPLDRREFLRFLDDVQARHGQVTVAVVRLDDTDTVAAALGEDATDDLLEQAARRIRQSGGSEDAVARLGMTTFAITHTGVADRDGGRALARRLQDLLNIPFLLEGTEVFGSPKIGVSLGGAGTSGEGVLLSALAALERLRPGTPVAVVEAVGRDTAHRRLSLQRDLRHSIERDELRLHFQPVVDVPAVRVAGAEALVRWQHPERGLLAPGEFIAHAEDSNFIGALGAWVLRASCRQASAWTVDLPADTDFSVSVNVSPNQLGEPGFIDTVSDALAMTSLAPGRLQLEVTESTLLDADEEIDAVLQALVDLGVGLAVDDFGIGHASLDHLRRIPANTVKIDRSFIDGFPDQARDTTIVEGAISLAHALGRTTVAEGVETMLQLDLLGDLGCDQAQGFAISRPVPADQITARFGQLGRVDPDPER